MPDLESNVQIAFEFNEFINRQNLPGLTGLMTDDHTFIDSDNTRFEGRKVMLEAWGSFFESFPSYKNYFDHISSKGDMVIMIGHSSCAEQKELDGPAIWTARIRDGKVAEWRVYEDTAKTRELIGVQI